MRIIYFIQFIQNNKFTFVLIYSREKNGTDVAKVKSLEGRYRIIAAERKFIIDRTDIGDDGVYSCVVDNNKRDINVVGTYNYESKFEKFFLSYYIKLL